MVSATAPPHDLEAEEALLGSCLLSRSGLEAALALGLIDDTDYDLARLAHHLLTSDLPTVLAEAIALMERRQQLDAR